MRIGLLLIFLSLSVNGISQDSTFYRNTLSFETGLFNRGLAGVSYSVNYLKTEFLFLSSDVYFGFGNCIEPYIGIGQQVNLGRDIVFLILGSDCKYYTYCLPTFSDGVEEYNGMAITNYAGLGVYAWSGFTVKFKLGWMSPLENGSFESGLPMLGLSVGKSFDFR